MAGNEDDDSDLKSENKGVDDDEVKSETVNRSARPTTARRRPPKLKENVKEVSSLKIASIFLLH